MAAAARILGVLLLLAAAARDAGAAGEEAAADADTPVASTTTKVAVETFTPPVAKSIDNPRYPVASQRQGQEGWVQLTFMVSPTGEPYDVAVVESSGGERFEAAAIDAVERWTFEPARLGDMPIDAGMNYMIQFALTDNAAATTGFVRTFRRLMQDIQEGDRDGADGNLADLQKRERNLYEEANLNLATYNYYQRWGTPEQQYPPLRRATAMKNGEGFLPDDVLNSLLRNRFAMELQLDRFADARSIGAILLERERDPDVRARVEAALAQIDALAASDQPISVTGRIDDSTHYFHRLLKKRFHFRDIEGDIAELRLHCDRDYVGFPFNADLAYTLKDDLGQCGLRVIGTPGTTFTLVET